MKRKAKMIIGLTAVAVSGFYLYKTYQDKKKESAKKSFIDDVVPSVADKVVEEPVDEFKVEEIICKSCSEKEMEMLEKPFTERILDIMSKIKKDVNWFETVKKKAKELDRKEVDQLKIEALSLNDKHADWILENK